MTTTTVTPRDPYPNKALAALVTALLTVALQWASTGNFNLGGEGATAIGGALATLLVYWVSNHRRLGR